jgi:homoaconitase/3-isopropylmalate dehydratase large subunit
VLPAWNTHYKEVMEAAKTAGIKGDFSSKGIFICPGYCGDCLPNGKHACGDKRFEDMAIVIGIH